MKTGALLITEERTRQIDQEGWTPEHDDHHTDHALAMAAACYASPELIYIQDVRANAIVFEDPWPGTWSAQWDKRNYNGNVVLPNHKLAKTKRIRQLAMAGALIAAEIDRLQRVVKDKEE